MSLLGRIYRGLEEPDHLQGLFALRQGAGPQDEGLSAEQNGRWWDALTLYELKSRAPAGESPLEKFRNNAQFAAQLALQLATWP